MLPQRCQVFSLSPLVRELLYRAVLVDIDYPAEGPQSRLMHVVLDELQALNPEPLYLLMAQDRQIRKIMDALMVDPGNSCTLDEWSHLVGATARTLARRFKRETGFSFGQWRPVCA
jgi:hypothetical protein